jgi:non-ribosomal peptide synthetase component F
MNAAQTIAETLNRHLTKPTEVVVFGAAALLLDRKFNARMAGRSTNDVDIIIPKERAMQVDADKGFWRAVERTNQELQSRGLYITHIFPEREVALTPEWRKHTVPLHHETLSRLNLQRPRVLDLVISKMGRGDAQDVADVRSMLRLHKAVTGQQITGDEIAAAARRAAVPEAYREIFPRACERIVAAARSIEVREKPPSYGSSISYRPDPPRQGPRMGM